MEEKNYSKKIDEFCSKYDRKDYPGIEIAVVDHGKLIYKKGFGIANLDYDIPIDENTVFHACSMTKQFTAACIALLIEEGRLSLEQEVGSLLPQWSEGADHITLAQLVYMTNGIPDAYDTANLVCGLREDEGITMDEFWRYTNAGNWKDFKPGEQWSYGNTGYFLMGQIIQAVTGKSLSQYADEFIFQPLGMVHTFIRDDHTKIIKNRAVGYTDYDQVHYNDRYERYTSRGDRLSVNQDNVEIGGAGQLWTTINDLLLWDHNFYDNQLGKRSDSLIRLLTTSGKLKDGSDCNYGFGLFLDEFHGRKIVHHGGWAGGYSAYYASIPEQQSAVIILGNHTDFEYEFGYQSGGVTEHILKLLLGEEDRNNVELPLQRNRKEEFEVLEKAQLMEYTGSYRNDVLKVTYKVSAVNGGLYITNDDLHNTSLDLHYYKIKGDTFLTDCMRQMEDACVSFRRDENHAVSSFLYRDESEAMTNHFLFHKIR